MEISLIRPEFIVQYQIRKKEGWSLRYDLIEARDNKHGQLNRNFGFIDPDGMVPIGCKSHVDIGYKQKYDRIESNFRAKYDAITPSEENWMRQSGVTLYEYLLLDNCSEKELEHLAEKARNQEGFFFDAINQKAAAYLSHWKTEYTIGYIQILMQSEVRNHHYARARCRKFFAIRPWEVSKHLAIFGYSRTWKANLNKCFRNLNYGKLR